MRLDFRQGIITYPVFGNQQYFLTISNTNVNLVTANGRTDIAFAHGNLNYLYTESVDVPNAWAGLPSSDAWLYWDLDTKTAVRTFGFTTVAPIFQVSTPTSPVEGLHWFNTDKKRMYAYISGGFREVIRVFAAKVNIGTSTFTPLGSGNALKPYAGTQVGLNTSNSITGRIVVDSSGAPIRTGNGTFFTTETEFFANGSPINSSRLDTAVISAKARENIGPFQVVQYPLFGEVNLASYEDLQTTVIGISMEPILTGNVGYICVQGCITNPEWNWPTVGEELWVTSNGVLTTQDPHVVNALEHPNSKPSIARVLTPTSIVFDALGGGTTAGVSVAVPDLALDDLTDVTIDSPLPNQYLIYNGSQWINAALSPINLNDLADVTITGLQATHILTFNGSQWINSPAPLIALDDLTDVTITDAEEGQVLTFNGTEWINGAASGQGELPPVIFPNLIADDLLDAAHIANSGSAIGPAVARFYDPVQGDPSVAVTGTSSTSIPNTSTTWGLRLKAGATELTYQAAGTAMQTYSALRTAMQTAFSTIATVDYYYSPSSSFQTILGFKFTALNNTTTLELSDGVLTVPSGPYIGDYSSQQEQMTVTGAGTVGSPFVITSTNHDDGSYGYVTFTFLTAGTINITATASSEQEYDIGAAYNDATNSNLVLVSGTGTATYTGQLEANNTVVFSYQKDGSGSDNSDNVSFTMSFTPAGIVSPSGIMQQLGAKTWSRVAVDSPAVPVVATSDTYLDTYADEYYIIAATGTPSGKWAEFSNGDLVTARNGKWLSLGNAGELLNGKRVGIAMNAQSIRDGVISGTSGTFLDKQYCIGTLESGTWTFYEPTDLDIVGVVEDQRTSDPFNRRRRYVFSTTNTVASSELILRVWAVDDSGGG